MAHRTWRKPRIRTVLLLANLVLLALPLGGLWLLRLYESALVRQTETELVAQAAVIAATFRAAWVGPDARPSATGASEGYWSPHRAGLDPARDPVLPPPPAAASAGPAEPRAAAAGVTLQAVLVDAQRVTLAAMRVVDRHGVVVATSREELGLSLAGQAEVAAALVGEPASVLRARVLPPDFRAGPTSISRGAAVRVFVARPVIVGDQVIGAVVLSRTPASIDQALFGKRRAIGGLALALLLAAGGLALFTAYTVSRPIQAVTAQAQAVAAGGRMAPSRVRRSAVREADELWAAIHAMADALERRADYIGAFASEVSHEFKTPLAALRGALELIQDETSDMTAAERDRFLVQAMADVERLDRLVRRLLELARAEAPQPLSRASCDVGDAVRAAAFRVEASGMRVTLEGPALPVQVGMGPEALRTVLANLLDNVRQHAGPGATCRIAWNAHHAAGEARLVLADDGRGISAGNASRVFDRFFTTAREHGGTGLGLPIARGQLEASGGAIRLLHGNPGAAFLITLPLV